MQKRTIRVITITMGLLSGATLLFLGHCAKEKIREEMIDDHRGLVKWYSAVQFYRIT